MSTKPWYERPLDRRAPHGGEEGVNGVEYKGGEYLPFYVPRPLMPQIRKSDLGSLIRFVLKHNIWVLCGVVKSDTLLHHQKVNWDPKRWNPEDEKKPILTAEDYFILDGNHRAYANRVHKADSRIIQFGLPFEAAIDLLFKFPRTTSGEQ